MKDWAGNKISSYVMLGASTHSQTERQANDYYATEPKAIDALLGKYKLPPKIWEPACGEGHLAKQLRLHGFEVFASDIIDRGFGSVADFFEAELPKGCECILTNPPYKYADKFIKRAIEMLPVGGVVAMFLKTQFLEGVNRYYNLFTITPPKKVFQFAGRMVCAKNGDFNAMKHIGSAVAYAWFVWEKGWKGQTTIEWIEPF